MTDQLSWLPKYNGEERACATYLARSDDDAYLVGLRYRTGVLWVSVLGNHCAGAGNGVFETPANLVKQAQTAYRTGAWPKPVDAGPCAQGTGRLGQEHEMVAGQPDRVTICRMDHGPTHRTLDDPGPLVRALNNAATSEWNGQCRPSGKASANIQYDLIFQYRDGPPLAVTVLTSCHPAVFNGSLASEMSSTLSGLLRATLKTR